MNPLQVLAHHHSNALRRDSLAFSALPDAPVLPDGPPRRSRLAALRVAVARRVPRRRVTCVSPAPTRMAA